MSSALLLQLTISLYRVKSIYFKVAFLAPFQPYKALLKALYSLPPSFFAENVISLAVFNQASSLDACRALEFCTNIESLAYWNSVQEVPRSVIAGLPLRRLSTEATLFSQLCKEANPLTHLRELTLIVSRDEDMNIPNFGVFPSLTHFAVSTISVGSLVLKLVNAMLATEQCLVMVLLANRSLAIDKAGFSTDRRFVQYPNQSGFLKEWKELEEGNSFWARAEKEIAGR